jgi:hypothetical protein
MLVTDFHTLTTTYALLLIDDDHIILRFSACAAWQLGKSLSEGHSHHHRKSYGHLLLNDIKA